MNERKYYSPEEKVKIVLEGLSGTILHLNWAGNARIF